MRRHIRIFWVLLKAKVQSVIEYRLSSLIWILNGIITPLLSMAIWLKISNQNSLLLGKSQIVTYFFMSIIVNRITQVWTLDRIGNWIKDGGIASVLVKPYSYIVDNLATQFSAKISRMIAMGPVMLVVGVLLGRNLYISFESWRMVLFAASLVTGFITIFTFEHVLSLLAFWVDEVNGINNLHIMLRGLFSGAIIPIAFMPGSLKTIMTFYPTRFIVSFPLEILIQHSRPSESISGFLIAAIWIILLVIIYKIGFTYGIKKFSAVGN
jgi:ABC-2 type transport system permease protein